MRKECVGGGVVWRGCCGGICNGEYGVGWGNEGVGCGEVNGY